MSKKLTLSINEIIIERAKKYAKQNKTSLSKLIENYLQSITESKTSEKEITPLVESLTGVIKLNSELDERKAYSAYLMEKYR